METEIKKKRNKAGANIVLPVDTWTLKHAHALNPSVCHSSVYNRVKYLKSEGKVIVCGKVQIGRGKPSLMYHMTTESDVVVAQEVVESKLPSDLPF